METTWLNSVLSLSSPITGWNLLAAEVHQSALTSSDLGFDLELSGTVVLVQPPELSATLVGSSLVLIAPTDAGYFTLYSATNLTPPVTWILMTNPPVFLNGTWNVTLPAAPNGQRFYRLQAP